MSEYVTETGDGALLIKLHVQPKASKDRLIGFYGERLKICVASPPVDGKANKAVVRFLAKSLGKPRREVSVQSGLTSRQKVVRVEKMSKSQVQAIIESMF